MHLHMHSGVFQVSKHPTPPMLSTRMVQHNLVEDTVACVRCACVRSCVHACAHACALVCVCVYVCTCAHMYVCLLVCLLVCLYVCFGRSDGIGCAVSFFLSLLLLSYWQAEIRYWTCCSSGPRNAEPLVGSCRVLHVLCRGTHPTCRWCRLYGPLASAACIDRLRVAECTDPRSNLTSLCDGV